MTKAVPVRMLVNPLANIKTSPLILFFFPTFQLSFDFEEEKTEMCSLYLYDNKTSPDYEEKVFTLAFHGGCIEWITVIIVGITIFINIFDHLNLRPCPENFRAFGMSRMKIIGLSEEEKTKIDHSYLLEYKICIFSFHVLLENTSNLNRKSCNLDYVLKYH